ncbi:MAG TPA: isoaspartyl peptidase/L-asparaginase [Bacteroidota bacterium]|nr:isoaspartyl peptidase/L-asparaginase [Bacteroidota bacterium]
MKRQRPVSLVVHGGAWNIPDDETEAHRAGVLSALKAGWELLRDGGTAIEAVERSITVMEDDETFNAGRGSALNASGEIELDASIMDGGTLRAGAVAAVQNIAHPISVARAIMEKSDAVLLVGLGAMRFAKERGIPTCGQDALITMRELARWRASQQSGERAPVRGRKSTVHPSSPGDTVGAVALDAEGRIASGTSTGGTPNKQPGRVGDSSLIGCGTYADNSVGGVSATGWGEGIIRVVMAKSLIEILRSNGADPEEAAKVAIGLLKKRTGGHGGAIVLNAAGGVGIAYNTPRMARAYMTSSTRGPIAAV